MSAMYQKFFDFAWQYAMMSDIMVCSFHQYIFCYFWLTFVPSHTPIDIHNLDDTLESITNTYTTSQHPEVVF